MTQISEAIQRIVDPMLKRQVVVGTVKSVDVNKQLVDVEVEEGFDRLDVKLTALESQGETGLLFIPKVDSWVLVQIIDNNPSDSFVCAFSEVDRVLLKTDSGSQVELTNDGEVHLNGTQFGALVKIEKLEQNLNSIKTHIDALASAVSAGLNGVGSGTGASGSAGAAAFNTSWSPAVLNYEQMNNDNVKHG